MLNFLSLVNDLCLFWEIFVFTFTFSQQGLLQSLCLTAYILQESQARRLMPRLVSIFAVWNHTPTMFQKLYIAPQSWLFLPHLCPPTFQAELQKKLNSILQFFLYPFKAKCNPAWDATRSTISPSPGTGKADPSEATKSNQFILPPTSPVHINVPVPQTQSLSVTVIAQPERPRNTHTQNPTAAPALATRLNHATVPCAMTPTRPMRSILQHPNM